MITLTVTAKDGITTIAAEGRLTMATAADLTAAIQAAAASDAPRVVVDLAETAFVDSSGLGALVSGLRTTRTAGGDLRIAAPTAQVSEVLALTNLDRVLKPYADVHEASHAW